jgi:hypothetical protein
LLKAVSYHFVAVSPKVKKRPVHPKQCEATKLRKLIEANMI